MLKPGWLASATEAGVALSQDGPTGTGSPATVRLVICSVMLDIVVTAPVVRSTLDRSAPGPSGTVALAALRNVLPFTGYLTLRIVSADATAGVTATMTAVRNPARAVTVAPRAARERRSRFMETSLVSGYGWGEWGFIVRKTAGQPPEGAGQCRQSGGCPSGR